jgi:hypothetical protein
VAKHYVALKYTKEDEEERIAFQRPKKTGLGHFKCPQFHPWVLIWLHLHRWKFYLRKRSMSKANIFVDKNNVGRRYISQ